MAGFDFDSEDGFPKKVDLENIKPEDILAKLNPAANKKLSEELNLKVRNYQKSVLKKISEISTSLDAMGSRMAPTRKTPEEMEAALETIIKKQTERIKRIGIQAEKEFDFIETKLKTRKGTSENFDDIIASKAELEQLLDGVDSSLASSAEQIRQKGMDQFAERQRKTDAATQKREAADRKREQNEAQRQRKVNLREARERAQQAGEDARRQYLEENRSELTPTLQESVTGFIDKFLLLGRRGSIASDARERRRRSLLAAGASRGAEAAKKSMEDAGFAEDDPKYKAKGPGEGFRAGDLGGMLPQLVGVLSTLAIVDQVAKQGIKFLSSTTQKFTNPNSSTADLFETATFSNLPGNYGGKLVTEMVRLLETIADNTSDELMPFSPELINASINRQIMFLEQNLSRADQLGPTLASIYTTRTELEMVVKETGDTILKTFAPLLIGSMEFTKDVALGIQVITEILGDSELPKNILAAFGISGLTASIIIDLLWKKGEDVMKRLKDEANEGTPFAGELEAFFGNRDLPGWRNTNFNPNVP